MVIVMDESKKAEVQNVLFDLETAIKKANYCQQEVCEDFFGKILSKSDTDVMPLEEFERFGTFANITQDNIIIMERALEKLQNLLK